MRKVGLAIGLVIIGFLLLWARAFHGSMKAYEKGEAFFQESDYVRAVTFFDRSIRWYTPFNPYVYKSADRLWQIGSQAERKGNIRLALIAVRTIRQAFRAAQNLYTPGKDWIQKCDTRIEQLLHIGSGPSTELRGIQSKPVDHNPNEAAPGTLWSLTLLFGFFGWIGSTIAFILSACKENRTWRISTSPGLLWGSMAAVCFILWLIGMMKA